MPKSDVSLFNVLGVNTYVFGNSGSKIEGLKISVEIFVRKNHAENQNK